MFKALLGKEWRQLRTLRWGGMALGLVLPWALLLGAEAAHRGWLPSDRVGSYSFGRLLTEMVPLFFAALWGLLALMLAVQAFSGDRTEGTERFLLERPVRRRAVWSARLVASFATLLALLAVHAAYLAFLVDRAGEGPLPAPAARLIWMAIAIVVCGYVGGMIAASALNSLQAALVGIAFAAAPWGLALVLSAQFPYAVYRTLNVGISAAALLPVGYFVASFLMLCRGEPEGRGRWRRGTAVLAVTALLIPIAFVSAAPLAMRMQAGRFAGGLHIAPAPAGDALAVVGGGTGTLAREALASGWIVGIESGEKRRFLLPGIEQAIWNADGSLVAVIHDSGVLGSRTPRAQVEVFDSSGRRVWKSALSPDIPFVSNPMWAGRYLVARTAESWRSQAVVFADVDNQVVRALAVDEPIRSTRLLGPTDDGSVFLFNADLDGNRLHSRLQRLDPATASLAEVMLDEEAVVPRTDQWLGIFLYRQRVSPSGRFLERRQGLIDLASGLDLEPESAMTSAWLTDDRYARLIDGVPKRLLLGRPGRKDVELGSFDDEVVLLFPSPDRRHLMVQVWSGAGGKTLKAAEFTFAQSQRRPLDSRLIDLWIVDALSGERIDRADWRAQLDTDRPMRLGWAGPSRLALLDDRSISTRSLKPTADLQRLIGK